jgi:hypothetical protein
MREKENSEVGSWEISFSLDGPSARVLEKKTWNGMIKIYS